MLHRHHIIPKHSGGTDHPSNIVKLTVAEHAAAHLELFKKYGKIQDKLAHDGLLGIVGKEDIVMELCASTRNTKWYFNPSNPVECRMLHPTDDIPAGWLQGRGDTSWADDREYGPRSKEAKARTSESLSKAWQTGRFKNRKRAEVTAKKKAGWKKTRGLKREKKQCPHCMKFVAVNTYPRWHGDNCKCAQQ